MVIAVVLRSYLNPALGRIKWPPDGDLWKTMDRPDPDFNCAILSFGHQLVVTGGSVYAFDPETHGWCFIDDSHLP